MQNNSAEEICLAAAPQISAAEVSPAPEALTRVEAAIKKRPDPVPPDILLPVVELARSLIPTVPPPIFLAASKESALRDKAKELGAAAFFQKPNEWEITPPKIRRIIPRQIA